MEIVTLSVELPRDADLDTHKRVLGDLDNRVNMHVATLKQADGERFFRFSALSIKVGEPVAVTPPSGVWTLSRTITTALLPSS